MNCQILIFFFFLIIYYCVIGFFFYNLEKKFVLFIAVRSFGTEDRDTQIPVAPQNQIYEYILFRGTDIKDIRVVSNVSSIPNDPAIVQVCDIKFL